ncbi:M9 family metallopeptidase N-terminal domain-containing protein [Clostridium sp.]|uniref:M9 family metallopeptidase N-terminal domain-containing protein n=1 Tax=Clostridium sp. TaxID=1506 RepID=UPI003463FDCD
MAKESNDKDIEPLGINGANDIKSSSENKESSDNKKLGNVNPSYQKKYTFKELNSLSYSDLIKTIKSISYSDVPELFKFTEDSYEFYKDENRVQALIDELYRIGQTYTKDDNQGIQTVVEFLRSAFYLGYYNEELKYLNTKEFQSRCIPAIEAIENNENFALGTRVQDEVVDSLGKFIANTVCTPEIVNGVTKIFHQYERNLEVYSKERSKGSAIYQLMNGIDYQIYTDLYHNDPKDTIFYGKIDGYIEEIEKLALLGNRANSDNMWLVDNALYFIGKIGNLRNDPRISQKVLTDAMMIYPYLSTQYFEAATRLSENFGGKNSNGQTIDMDAIRKRVRENTFLKTMNLIMELL